jgi:hypothetical protein
MTVGERDAGCSEPAAAAKAAIALPQELNTTITELAFEQLGLSYRAVIRPPAA